MAAERHQGSAQTSVLAGTGLLSRTYYDPYGRVRDLSPQPFTDHGFLGQVTDPGTGLVATGARSYDPDLGRFLSTDPLSVQDSAQTANAYTYAASNLVLYSDPSGLEPGSWCTTNECVERAVANQTGGLGAPCSTCSSSPPAPVKVVEEHRKFGWFTGGLKAVGGGLKDIGGGLGSGAWNIGPGLVGDTVGLLPFEWSEQFQQNVDNGKASLETWYGADTESFAYRASSVGVTVASLFTGAAEIKGAIKGGGGAKVGVDLGQDSVQEGQVCRNPERGGRRAQGVQRRPRAERRGRGR